MIDNISSQCSFGTRINTKKTLPKVKNAIINTFPGIESPSKYVLKGDTTSDTFKELNGRLAFLRAFIKTLYPDGGLAGHVRGVIALIKTFKVANCDEFAEITKIILHANGIKNCDTFQLCAGSANGKTPPRILDHAVTAIGVKKSLSQNPNTTPFVPRSGIIIMDSFLDGGYIGKVKNCKKQYKIFGLQPDEILMLKPIHTRTPDKESLERVKKEFPSILAK